MVDLFFSFFILKSAPSLNREEGFIKFCGKLGDRTSYNCFLSFFIGGKIGVAKTQQMKKMEKFFELVDNIHADRIVCRFWPTKSFGQLIQHRNRKAEISLTRAVDT